MKQHLKEIGLVFILVVLILAGLAGIQSWPKKETSVGYYFVSRNTFGIAIYQKQAHASVQFDGYPSFTLSGNTVKFGTSSTESADINYSRDDIIFDDKGTLYTEPPTWQWQELNRELGVALTKYSSDTRIVTLNSNHLFLVNPHLAGALELTLGADKPATISRDQDKISNNVKRTSVTVIVHDTVSELSNKIL